MAKKQIPDTEKLYELRQDVWTPAGFWRAGMKKTEKEWHQAFGDFYMPFCSEWFINLSEYKEPDSRDELQDLVNKVFERKKLNSISYKEAAREIAELWLKQNQQNDADSRNSIITS